MVRIQETLRVDQLLLLQEQGSLRLTKERDVCVYTPVCAHALAIWDLRLVPSRDTWDCLYVVFVFKKVGTLATPHGMLKMISCIMS